MKAKFSSASHRDVRRAIDYYRREGGFKVADEFVEELEAKIQKSEMLLSHIELSRTI